MDEPLGALDAALREVMCEELRRLHERIGATTVCVTHDQVEAMTMADQIAVMNYGEVLQIAAPAEIYARPRTRFLAGFIGPWLGEGRIICSPARTVAAGAPRSSTP